MQKDKQFRVSGKWALASDGVQWVIQYQKNENRWEAVKFIHSTKEWLAYRLGFLKVPPEDAEQLLEGLPDTFEEWRRQSTGAGHDALGPQEPSVAVEEPA